MAKKKSRNYESLSEEILARHDTLSKRLKQIANYVLENPTAIALDTIAGIAQNADVQPSALIRFAKAFDFGGFSEMQRIFQAHIAEQSASYKERVKSELAKKENAVPNSPSSLLSQYCAANVVSLEQLQSGIDPKTLKNAVSVLAQAQHIYVIGQRRSFPVAAYLAYTLSHADYGVHLLDGVGGMLLEHAQVMTRKDVLIAVSFHSYSTETRDAIAIAENKNVPIIAITDSALSPIAGSATYSFTVHDAEVHSVRSLTASMCLAQTIATSLVFLETNEVKKTKVKSRRSSRQR